MRANLLFSHRHRTLPCQRHHLAVAKGDEQITNYRCKDAIMHLQQWPALDTRSHHVAWRCQSWKSVALSPKTHQQNRMHRQSKRPTRWGQERDATFARGQSPAMFSPLAICVICHLPTPRGWRHSHHEYCGVAMRPRHWPANVTAAAASQEARLRRLARDFGTHQWPGSETSFDRPAQAALAPECHLSALTDRRVAPGARLSATAAGRPQGPCVQLATPGDAA